MIKIGIIGDFLKTAGIISSILEKSSFSVKIINYKHFFSIMQSNIDFLIIGICSPYTSSDYINKLQLDILIINDSSQITNLTNPPFISNKLSIVLLNSDKSEKIELKTKTPFYVITFGFNSNATITISSRISGVNDTLQICIQRNLMTLQNVKILEQDFSITANSKNIDVILSAISAAILSGISIDTLKNMII